MAENSSSSQLVGGPARVALSPEVMERMERDILNTFRAVTGRGAEIGGVLLGAPACNGYGAGITGYRLVPCGYAKGPLYVLSEAEKSELREVARKEQAIGLFRSHTRRELALSGEDLALARECFPDGHPVFLLVKPFATKPPVAGVFHPNGSGAGRVPDARFPFHATASRANGTPESHRIEAPEALASMHPEPEPAPVQPPGPAPEEAAPLEALAAPGPPSAAPEAALPGPAALKHHRTPGFAQLPARGRLAKIAWSLFAVAVVTGAGLFAYYDGWLPVPHFWEATAPAPDPPTAKPPEQASAPKQPEPRPAAPPAARTVLAVEQQKPKQALPPPAPKPRPVNIPEPPPRVDSRLEMNLPLPQVQTPAAPPPAAQSAAPAKPASVKLSRAPVLLRQEAPKYPIRARTAGVQGTIQLRAVIGPDGRVRSVTALSGPLQLRAAAAEAVRNWTYLPALQQGEPVEGTAEIELRFALRN